MLRGTYPPETLEYGGMVTLSFNHGPFKRFHTNSERLRCVCFTLLISRFLCCVFFFLRWNCFIFVFTNLSYWVNTTKRGTIWLVLLCTWVESMIVRNVLPFSYASWPNLSSPASNTAWIGKLGGKTVLVVPAAYQIAWRRSFNSSRSYLRKIKSFTISKAQLSPGPNPFESCNTKDLFSSETNSDSISASPGMKSAGSVRDERQCTIWLISSSLRLYRSQIHD